jgi:hypothetical protein
MTRCMFPTSFSTRTGARHRESPVKMGCVNVGNAPLTTVPCCRERERETQRERERDQRLASLLTHPGVRCAHMVRWHVPCQMHFQGDNQQHGVHPRFKTKPAERLALQLLHTAFGLGSVADGGGSSEWSGPLAHSAALSKPGHSAGVAMVRVALSHSVGLRLNDTQTCNEQFKRLCCGAGDTAWGARLCTAASPDGCARDADGHTVFNANVTADAGSNSILISAKMPGTPKYVDFGQTDFPQCSVVNSIGAALGPFGPMPVLA